MQTQTIFPYSAMNLKISLIINVKTVKPKTFFLKNLHCCLCELFFQCSDD